MVPLLILMATVASLVGSGQASDPCDPGFHTEVDDPKRSTGFFLTSSLQTPLCDIHLREGWYRFISNAGGQMPTTCPKRFACGTSVPIWMSGTVPATGDGTVERVACANYNGDCCGLKRKINVRNCGNFIIYYLRPTPSCSFAYCAGGVPPCPFGEWSPTSLPPCEKAFPTITTSPILRLPIVEATKFYFECEIIFPDNYFRNVFEVTWTFDGKEDKTIPAQNLTDPDRIGILDGALLKDNLNKQVQCRVRGFLKGNEGQKGPYLYSNSYFAGIQLNPTRLTVSEDGDVETINVTSTVPVVCDHQFECCLTFNLDFDLSSDVTVENQCAYELCSGNWDPQNYSATIEVPVVAKQNLQSDGEKAVLMTFKSILPDNGGPYLHVFSGHQPDQVQIVTKDQATSQCHITGDPHFLGFDNESPYHLYLTGDFTVVEVPSRHFQVQIRTWLCNNAGTVTCICGIVVREKNDIIRIDQCDQPRGGAHTATIVSIPRELGDGVIVQRSRDGGLNGIYLLSGAEIRLDGGSWGLNLHITLPGADKGKARGICGTNDGIRENDFTGPDGTRVEDVCRDCQPNKFFETWKVDLQDSLFEVVPDVVNDAQDVQYCACGNKNGQAVVNCTSRINLKPSSTACPRCRDIKPDVDEGWSRRKREERYADADLPDTPYVQENVAPVDPDKKWPNSKGTTEAEAREMCTKALGKSQLGSKGAEMSNIYETAMTNCLNDILFGETTQFLDSITAAFTAQTQIALAKDPDNYVSDAEGNSVMKAEYLDDICDLKCDEHGQCGKGGVCECDDGWEGISCHIESGKGPQMDKIRSGPLCDKAQRPCEKIFTDVSNVDLSDDLICRVQAVDEQGNNLGQPIDTNATSLSAFRIACNLPVTDSSSQRYNVSASNDGSLFGNGISLHVFDSTCMDCSETGCTVKTTACHIDKVCYRDGKKKNDDPYKVCDVTKNTTDWTILPRPTTTPATTPATTTPPQPTPTSVASTVKLTTSTTPTPVKTEPTTILPDNPGKQVDVSIICRDNHLSNGLHPHPYDCGKFIQCAGTRTYVMDCPDGLAFDQSLQSCNYRNFAKSC